MSYYVDFATLVCIQLIAVAGMFAVAGLTGLFSLGQGGFMAIGAYVAALSHMRLGVPWPLAVLLGVAVSCGVSAVVGYPALKLQRDFFALVTFGFGEAITALFQMFNQVTGGTMGLAGIPRYTTFWLAFALAALSIAAVANLKRSKLGRNSIAIRSDELAAESLGIDVFAHKLQVFVFGAGLAALAGGLQAFFINYMDPKIFSVWTSVEQVIYVYFGGISSLTGAVVSTLLLRIVPEFFSFANLWRVVIYSVLIVITLNLRPQGLMGDYEFSLGSARSLLQRAFAGRRRASLKRG
jgi:branched-chain amino acid transport system permease protein